MPDRSFGAFLRAIRDAPGFSARVAGTTALALSVTLGKGWTTAAWATATGIVVLVLIGYPRFRRRGRLGA